MLPRVSRAREACAISVESIAPVEPDRRPRIDHRWHIAWVSFLSTGLPIGIIGYAFGVFIEPLEQEFGWSRSEINLSLSLGLITGLLAVPVGSMVDRFGSRPVMFGSLLVTGAGLMVAVFMQELWQLYLASILIFAGQPGATALPVGRLIGIWFPRTRGRMMGLVMAGNNFGGITMVPLASFLVVAAGWRYAYLGFAAIIFVLAFIVLLVISDRPPAASAAGGAGGTRPETLRGMTVRQAMRTRTFYFITAGLTATSFTYSAVLSQLIPHLTTEGFSDGSAAFAVSLVAVFGFMSKLAFGRLSERIGARYSSVLSILIQAAGLSVITVAGGNAFAFLGVVVFGMGFGAVGALIPLNIGEAFGIRYFGSLLGIINLVGIFPVIFGPIMAGTIYDNTGHYQLAFAITIGIFLFAAVCMAFAQHSYDPDRVAAT